MSAERIADYCHYLTAWRAWKVRDGRLKPLTDGEPLPPRQRWEAGCKGAKGDVFAFNSSAVWREVTTCPHCHADLHVPPVKNCECGLWGFKTKEALEAALDGYEVHATGQIALWGKVMEHEHGYRGQFGYPLRLWAAQGYHEALAAYDVPVGLLSEGPQVSPPPVFAGVNSFSPYYHVWSGQAYIVPQPAPIWYTPVPPLSSPDEKDS